VRNVSYNIKPILADDADLTHADVPRWLVQFLNLVNREPLAFQRPIKGIFEFCFEGLLHDAITNSFERVESILGESLGNDEEREIYRGQVLSDYRDKKLEFASVYLPLVLGGITSADLVVLSDDNMEDAVHDLRDMVNIRRHEELNDDTSGLFSMTDNLMEKVLLKYGYDAKRM
jgi:hypothetical protein